jgi:hypothetical protein
MKKVPALVSLPLVAVVTLVTVRYARTFENPWKAALVAIALQLVLAVALRAVVRPAALPPEQRNAVWIGIGALTLIGAALTALLFLA